MSTETALPKWAQQKLAKERRNKPGRQAPQSKSIHVEHKIEFDCDTVTYPQFQCGVWAATATLASELEQHDIDEANKRHLLANVFDGLYDLGPRLWERICAEAKREFDKSERVADLPIGPVTYHLRQSRKTRISVRDDHSWEYTLDKFAPTFIGVGESITAAQRGFLNTVHAAFQSLVTLRPFQMSESQISKWQVLERLIDVDRYWASVPVTLLEIGVVAGSNENGWEVVWLDGERRELLPVEKTLPEFAAFENGQWFEALVERQPKTYELRNLRYVRATDPLVEMDQDGFREWLESLPSGEDLPKSGTDWATL